MSQNLIELQEQKRLILGQIESLQPFRPGSIVVNFRKCGKRGCHCSQKDNPGHGPRWLLTWAVKGKTVTKIVNKNQVEYVRAQVHRFHEFQKLVQAYIETNIQICDEVLKKL